MKTAVKVLTILGVASCFISLLTLLFYIGNIDYFIDSINTDGTLTTAQIEMLTSIYKFVFVIGILQSIAGIAIGIIHTVFLFKNKTKKQISTLPADKGFVVKDDTEYVYQNSIPLWMFGFVY